MSKFQVVFTVVVAAVLAASIMMIKSQKDELSRKDKMISNLWSDKFSNHQFLVNTTYRDVPAIGGFIRDLDKSIGILRGLSFHKELTEEERGHLLSFISDGLIGSAGTKETEICETLQVESLNQIFQGEDFEVVERLERVINPFVLTRCREYQPLDIYEKRDSWDFKEGDTVKLVIRLLSNYFLRSHEVELLAQENLELIDPYLGEFTYVASDSAVDFGRHRIYFNTYDWISQDTIENEVILMGGDRSW